MVSIKGLGYIYKKEIRTYFVQPIAYIVIGLFIIFSALLFFFFSNFFMYNRANLRSFFGYLPFFFCLIIPIITMHLFSDEISTGSYELLLTMPVKFMDIIIGKFLAALTLTAICLLPTLLSYGIFVSYFGKLDWGPVLGGFLGALLMGAAFCGIGLFASSLTRSQIIAVIIGCGICFCFWLFDKIAVVIPLPQLLVGFTHFIGIDYHFQNITKGIIDTRDIVYFLSVCFFSLYGTKLVMEEKK